LGATLNVAVCRGTANAKCVLEDLKAGGKFSECHFIEFMACPGGCLGGEVLIPTSPEIRAARAQAIYTEEASYQVRKSHEKPPLIRLNKELLTDGPCGHTSHHLLHTHYAPPGTYLDRSGGSPTAIRCGGLCGPPPCSPPPKCPPSPHVRGT
jgi:NADH-quinone oxidoreductase subunit G/[NiFe] hydrogenase diaphorase moiety small subunit